MIKESILKILEEKREIEIEELMNEIKEHPGVIIKIIGELKKENKITIDKIKNKHKPKKYRKIIKLVV